MPTQSTIVDFEDSLKQLEDIVTKMEQGQLSLEDSLSAFEKGITLTRQCQETLKNAQQRVNTLTEGKDGAIELSEFDTSSSDSGI